MTFMSKETLYVTRKMMESFLVDHYQTTGERLSTRELIWKMNDQGLLLTVRPDRQTMNWQMDREEFAEAFLSLPINATRILENSGGFSEIFREEQSAFPPGQDVFCYKMPPYMTAELRGLSYFEIFYVRDGECEMKFGTDTVRLRAGDVCIVPPNAPHALPLDQNCHVVNTIVRASTFDAQFGDLLTKSGTMAGFFRESLYARTEPNFLMVHTPTEQESVRFHMRGLIIQSRPRDRHTNDCAICALKLFLSEALRASGDEVEIYRSPVGGNPRADCGEILQFIHQNYQTVRLSTLARQFHYNETYLSRMLQNYAHKSFTEIVRDIRMKRAEEYLNNSSLRVHEISSLVGYSSVDHFSRAFKATHGVSPQAYRREGLSGQSK